MTEIRASKATPEPAPPSTALLSTELLRSVASLSQFMRVHGSLRKSLPRGEGDVVLVLPGLGAGDWSTWPLRRLLDQIGYRAYGWGQGTNSGARHLYAGAAQRYEQLRDTVGGPISIIGWSLGGVYARRLAKDYAADTRCVITMGSPFAHAPSGSNIARLYRRLHGHYPGGDDRASPRMVAPPPVPTSSIFSRTDGVVPWQSCQEVAGPIAENIEVTSSHCGLGHDPAVIFAVADRLAQARRPVWKPFRVSGRLRRKLDLGFA